MAPSLCASGRSHLGLDTPVGDSRSRSSCLGATAASAGELIRQVERGFSFKTLQAFESRSGLAVSRIASIIRVRERILVRRKGSGRLTPEVSERLLRISAVLDDGG